MAEPFYQCITDFIFLEDELRPADLIFVPGGNYPDTAREAARLYHEGLAMRILPSGRFGILSGRFDGPYETEWEYLHSILRQEGVPDQAILKEDRATYTYENAIRSREVTDRAGIEVKTAILCCQAFHARRSWMYYQEQFPKAAILVHPVETRGITRDSWFRDPEKIDVVLGEVERCGSQFHEILRQQSRR